MPSEKEADFTTEPIKDGKIPVEMVPGMSTIWKCVLSLEARVAELEGAKEVSGGETLEGANVEVEALVGVDVESAEGE